MIDQILQEIIEMEWDMFEKVNNRGGRASCQNDRQTFLIMRKSQLLAWNESMLHSYYNDLEDAKKNDRNLMTEKYAFMMKNTSPMEYNEIKQYLPDLPDEQMKIIEEICSIQVKWYVALACQYPNVSGRGRPIHSFEDKAGIVSFETYLRGELSTYSCETQMLYWEFVVQLHSEGRNLNRNILENTALQFGYVSLEDAEQKIKSRL